MDKLVNNKDKTAKRKIKEGKGSDNLSRAEMEGGNFESQRSGISGCNLTRSASQSIKQKRASRQASKQKQLVLPTKFELEIQREKAMYSEKSEVEEWQIEH
jgi:hypothetical protein